MIRRISRGEFAQRMGAAKEAFATDLQSAAGDAAKVALATNKLRWAEETANEAFNHRSYLYRFFDSIPVIGKPFAIILDSVELGITEHGLVLGLAKGLLIGTIIAIALVVATEMTMVGVEVVREGTALTWTAGIRSSQRVHAMDEDRVIEEQRVFHRGGPIVLQQPIHCSTFDETRMNANIVDGSRTDATFESLVKPDPAVLNRRRTLNSGTTIIPFFHYFAPSYVYVLHVKTPIAIENHHDVATVTDPETGDQYVVAALPDDLLALIPLQEYRSMRLPLHEDVVVERPAEHEPE